jgi:hypothetical protein
MLLNPNQIRAHGVEVDDVPRHLSGGKSTHSINVHEANLRIPLKLHGVISYFDVRTPTLKKISECETITLTSQEVKWQPHSSDFNQLESLDESSNHRNISIMDASDEYDLVSRQISKMVTQNKVLDVKEQTFSKRWAVPIKLAQDTIKSTTQRFIRSSLIP